MKVAVVHNRYRSDAPSGENLAVEAEIALLREAGIDTVSFVEDSDTIPSGLPGMVKAGPGPVYSRSAVRRFRRLLSSERPDVVHVHNVFPLISPWVIRTARAAGIPVVRTSHNYRLSCVNGLQFRDGRVCTDCDSSRLQLPGLIHGCYRGSRMQTAPMTVSQTAHRSTWHNLVSAHIALTPFMARRLARVGVSPERIHIRPSWVRDRGHSDIGAGVLFVGRIDGPKGIPLLLSAWGEHQRRTLSHLTIVGDGPLRPMVEERAAQDPSVRFMGAQPPDEVSRLMRACSFVVVPSIWFEGYPLVLAEAFSHGRGVLTVAGGACESVVSGTNAGWVARPRRDSLGRVMSAIGPSQSETAGEAARRTYERDNSPEAALRSLTEIYASVVSA